MTVDDVDIIITRKRVKRVTLKVVRGQATVVCPLFYSDVEIRSFVLKNIDWLKNKMSAYRAAPAVSFADGSAVPMMGRNFPVAVKTGRKKDEVFLSGGALVFALKTDDEEKKKKLFAKWAREQLGRVLDRKIAEWSAKTGLVPAGYKILDMRSLWGSCNIRTHELHFNLKLIFQPVGCVDYVVLHELTHLKYPRHDKAFYECVSRFMPDYKAIKKRLIMY